MSPHRQAVFILTDTQGADVIGCYHPGVALGTPHLDGLARSGVRFDAAYTCSPVCGPARSAIFTGLYPHSNGVLGNDMAPALNLPTIGQRLRDAGIATGFIGKWHLDGTDYFGDGRCPAGWDPKFWFDGRNYLDSLPDQTARDLSRQVLGPEAVAEHGITSEFTHAHRTVDRALEFIRRHRHQDFFLVVSIDEPHHPAICPEPFVSAFRDFKFPVRSARDDLTGKPRQQQEWAAYQAREAELSSLKLPGFFGCNSYCDSQIGRVLDAVDSLTPEAMVTYTSDHGDMMGNHRLWGKGPVAYQEVTRVPFLVRLPGAATGVSSPGPVSHIDLVPTWLDYFGLPIPDLLQGTSLLTQVHDPKHPANDCAFIEFHRFEVDHDGYGAFFPIRCACDGSYKLAINLLDRDEFYDLTTDPCELHNRIDEGGASRDHLFEQILDWMNRTRDPFRGPAWHRRPWRQSTEVSPWGGPTRPRPFDEAYTPKTLLYDTGQTINRYEYEKR